MFAVLLCHEHIIIYNILYAIYCNFMVNSNSLILHTPYKLEFSLYPARLRKILTHLDFLISLTFAKQIKLHHKYLRFNNYSVASREQHSDSSCRLGNVQGCQRASDLPTLPLHQKFIVDN